MFIRNINKFRAEKRYSAKTTSMDRKASGSSKKSCSSWDRAEIRAGLNKYLVKIRKYHEDPFLAETEEPTLFDLINMLREQDEHEAQVEIKRKEMGAARAKLNESERAIFRLLADARLEYANKVFSYEYARDGEDCYYEDGEHVYREYWGDLDSF